MTRFNEHHSEFVIYIYDYKKFSLSSHIKEKGIPWVMNKFNEITGIVRKYNPLQEGDL